MEIFALIVIILSVLTLYVTRRLPIEVTSMLILPALYFTGILDFSQTLSGLSSSATITIAAMYILSAGLVRTGALEFVTHVLRHSSRGSVFRFLLMLALVVPPVSAIMNNTPVVIMLVPVILTLAREFGSRPSKLMIPLSYFAILGGTCTLIGTSTNILMHELYIQAGGPGFGMWDFAWVGVIYVFFGVLFIITIGKHYLPDRVSLSTMMPKERMAKFVTEIEIEEDSELFHRRVGDIFNDHPGVRLLELVRGEEVVLAPNAMDLIFEKGDALLIEGSSSEIASFLSQYGASLTTVVEDDRRVPMRSMELMLAEAVVLPDSPFVGRTVSELALNKRYGVKVLAVQRWGRHHRYKIRRMILERGDVLLLQSDTGGFSALQNSEAVLIMEGLEQRIHHKRRGFLAVGIMAAVIALAATTSLPIGMLAVTGAGLMVATRCLRVDEAIGALDASVLLLLVGTIPLGVAITETGLAEMIVNRVMAVVGSTHPYLLLSAIYLLTSLMTQVLSNNATAVLMTPIVLGASARMGVDPKPFLMAIAYAASASFMSPIGYQTNMIVMGPGGYTFKDYLKVGIPLSLIMWILGSIFIPMFWPF